MKMDTLSVSQDGLTRCAWCAAAPEFPHYHDTEWGFPVTDDRHLFEKLSLEAFQAGLSWRTILRKRDGFRSAFCNFDFNQVANFSSLDVDRLMQFDSIVRHRGKIEAIVNNAQRAQELIAEKGSLAAFFWSYEPDPIVDSELRTVSTSAESLQLSKDLKKRGWKFVGPTTVYAFMQAMGLVNDHATSCFIRAEAEKAHKALARPMT